MESLFALIFLSIQKRINDTTPVRYIVEDSGQLKDEKPGLSYPAVLIAIEETSFNTGGANYQQGVLSVKVTVVTVPYSSTSNITPLEYRQKGLKYYDHEKQVHDTLQGWSPDFIVDGADVLGDITGSLDRTKARMNRSRGDLRIRECVYSLGVDDFSNIVLPDMAPVNSVTFAAGYVGNFVDDLSEDGTEAVVIDL